MNPATKPIDGLPEGIDYVRIGNVGDSDYQIVLGQGGHRLTKGPSLDSPLGVIVRPEKGYVFRPARKFDIGNYVFVDGPAGTFDAIKEIEPVEVKATITCRVDNEFDLDIIQNIFEALKKLPGFQGLVKE